ncbi:MAG: hypothetical protein EB015_15410 [Methylocystaceae bacterium]|nr:hypothetical protein [Methylocystaceae bacterium]
MKHSVAYRALAVAAFGALAINSMSVAKASTDEDIAFLKARLKQLEAQVAKSNRASHDSKGTGQGLIGTGTTGSRSASDPSANASAGPGTTGRYEGGSAPDPMASLEHWYDRLSIRGYTQMRYNDILSATNMNDVSTYNDRFVGPRQNFGIRRARLIFSGDVSEHMYVYTQFDMASGAINPRFTSAGTNTATSYNPIWAYYNGGMSSPQGVVLNNQVGTYDSATGNVAQIRDLYADIYFDKDKEFRARPGYSKIPYGFTNMQSSQNRITLDRPDALNSATPDERDLGLFFYYTPKEMRHLFRDLVKNNLKGSGDYGMLAFGVYNGQGLNKPELNKGTHIVARATYPYVFENGQVVEASIQGYTGRYMPYTQAIRPSFGMATNNAGFIPSGGPFAAYSGISSMVPYVNGPGYNNLGNYAATQLNVNTTPWAPVTGNGAGLQDSRVAVTGVIYPQPFGVQAEWNWGVTPTLDYSQTAINSQRMNGGYALINYKYEDKDFGLGTFFPFVQYEYYNGGLKVANNSPMTRVNNWSAGVEYQPLPEVEVTAQYEHMDRTNTGGNGLIASAAPYRQFQADLIRGQLQWNY